MPFATTTTATWDDCTASTISSNNRINLNIHLSLLPLEQQQPEGQLMSAFGPAMDFHSLSSSLASTLHEENDHRLFQSRSSTSCNNNGVDRLIAILDAALAIVDDASMDEDSLVVEDSASVQVVLVKTLIAVEAETTNGNKEVDEVSPTSRAIEGNEEDDFQQGQEK
jgi:hypothetical protein